MQRFPVDSRFRGVGYSSRFRTRNHLRICDPHRHGWAGPVPAGVAGRPAVGSPRHPRTHGRQIDPPPHADGV